MILLVIFLIQITYVTLFTLRTIFVVRGKTHLAAIISIIEVFIYISGLSIVLANLDNVLSIIVYSLSYGLGILLGSFIENKMALGYTQVQVITKDLSDGLPHLIRDQGFGVTSWVAEGRDGPRLVLNILAKRKCGDSLERTIKELDPEAFLIAFEPTRFKGGFLAQKVIQVCGEATDKLFSNQKEQIETNQQGHNNDN